MTLTLLQTKYYAFLLGTTFKMGKHNGKVCITEIRTRGMILRKVAEKEDGWLYTIEKDDLGVRWIEWGKQ